MRRVRRKSDYATIDEKNQPLSRNFRRVVILAHLWYNGPVDAG